MNHPYCILKLKDTRSFDDRCYISTLHRIRNCTRYTILNEQINMQRSIQSYIHTHDSIKCNYRFIAWLMCKILCLNPAYFHSYFVFVRLHFCWNFVFFFSFFLFFFFLFQLKIHFSNSILYRICIVGCRVVFAYRKLLPHTYTRRHRDKDARTATDFNI